MLTRYLVPLGAVCIGLPVMVFVLPRLLIGKPIPDSIGDFDRWSPSPSDIRQAVGSGTDGIYSDNRHTTFARMFQQRFRNNQKAVGVSFAPNGIVKAKFAASIPRWDMAAVALQLHREAKEVFGRDFRVDIFETYISMTPIKLAELRDRPGLAGPVVTFNPRFALDQARVKPDPHDVLTSVLFSRVVVPDAMPNVFGWLVQARMDARWAMMTRLHLNPSMEQRSIPTIATR